ncbi:MAG: hypothetical protein IIA07_01110 [Proteobacteria bacterium]|nr:hypothetical protein [Pseudomonadota bacterium]
MSGKRVAYEQYIIVVRIFTITSAESLYRQRTDLASRQPHACLKLRFFEKIRSMKGLARIGDTD